MANQTRQLARLLAEEGVAIQTVQTNAPYRPAWTGRIRFMRAVVRFVGYAIGLMRATQHADLVHVMANSGWAWHLFAAPAIWIARLRNVPVLVNYRGGEAGQFLARQIAWVRPTLRRANALVVPSAFLREVFSRHALTAEIVPNIIDLSRFSPAPQRPFGLHFLVARNLEDIYDIPTSIRAFHRIWQQKPEARMTIAGSGPALPALQRLTEELGVARSVAFAGRVDNEQMAQLFRSADVLLNPTTVDNMPISLLEAMASGVPIVSTDVGGIPFLVEHERTALLVPMRSPQAMADAALRLIKDAALRERLIGAGSATVVGYTWAQVWPRLMRVYERCAGRSVPKECVS